MTGAVLAMAVGAFCYVTMETLPVGLLPLIADDLDVSLRHTGLLVTGYGVTVAVTSVPLAYLTRGVPRRLLFPALLAVFALATLGSGLAGSFRLLFGARLVVALSQAVFWSVAGPTVASLVAAHLRGRATAVVFGGAGLAPTLGVPAGTLLGQRAGWRWAFLVLAGAGLLAGLLLAALLPDEPATATEVRTTATAARTDTAACRAATDTAACRAATDTAASADTPAGTHTVGATRRQAHRATAGSTPDSRRYGLLVLAVVLAITGMYTAYTYTAPFLTDVSGFSPGAVSPLLLLRGVVDLAGITVAGIVVDRGHRTALAGTVALLTVAWLGMFVFADVKVLVAASLALSGFALGGFTPAMQSRVLDLAPGDVDLASAGTSAAFNVGISCGAFVGGAVLAGPGLRATALVGGAALALATLVVLVGRPPRVRAAGPRGAG